MSTQPTGRSFPAPDLEGDGGASGRVPRSTIGVLVGLLLTVVIVAGGFTGLLLAIVLGSIGWVAGAQLDGVVDVRSWIGSRRD